MLEPPLVPMTRQKPSLHSVFFTFVTRCLDAHWKARAASARDNTDQYGHSSKLISTVDFYYPFNIVLFNAVKPRGGCPGTPSHYTSHGASTNSPNEPRSARETMHTSYNVQSRHDTLRKNHLWVANIDTDMANKSQKK